MMLGLTLASFRHDPCAVFTPIGIELSRMDGVGGS